MIQIETSVDINRPVEQVAEFFSDNENALLWQTGLIETRLTSEPNRVGSTWTDVVQVLGRRIELSFVATEVEPESRFAFKSTSGPIPVSGSYTMEPAGDSTRVTFALEAEPIVKRVTLRQWEANLANLKDLLEAD